MLALAVADAPHKCYWPLRKEIVHYGTNGMGSSQYFQNKENRFFFFSFYMAVHNIPFVSKQILVRSGSRFVLLLFVLGTFGPNGGCSGQCCRSQKKPFCSIHNIFSYY